ncbi:hypothetical protein [Escherichia coli]|uniref:hypothetical protein n=1 Tax=Escherichia coli TaxID=562 RepID=UPI0039A611E7
MNIAKQKKFAREINLTIVCLIVLRPVLNQQQMFIQYRSQNELPTFLKAVPEVA